MNDRNPFRTGFYAILGVGIVVIGSAISLYAFRVEHVATASQTRTFIIEVDFDRFRQIIVRKNGTESIIGYSGMKLLDQRVMGLEVDATGDHRPLLNAIRGKSKTDVSAVKILTVELNDASLDADQLQLRQVAEIEPTEINVVTTSTSPAGRLDKYTSNLQAKPRGKSTTVTATVTMAVRTNVSRLFVSHADKRVQQAADDAVAQQQAAMTQFFAEHSKERLIVPDFAHQQ